MAATDAKNKSTSELEAILELNNKMLQPEGHQYPQVSISLYVIAPLVFFL